jgi:hypothetical protein
MFGSSAIARAIATRLIIPPLNSAGSFCAASSSPTSRSFESAIMSIKSDGNAVYSSNGRRMFSSTVIEPNSAPP